ncbi:hypothetical protein DQ244_14675 [Blastococcus sp. TBT05-19]|uniref:hypothetical protein n=1 Tax=Blastococcus sp. TBT05-19 TaxID=2250581 RepID=UPI000DEBC904|nr:hypothetical protein [Blastococcus sp. TBT05-19]RBY89015.1 hypothetical protein DQ244_14675 [Blastococcus sp. TBT05-19]
MTSELWVLIAAGVLVLLAAWTGWTLTRLRRLDQRMRRAEAALEAQLRRRAGLAEELARNHPAALGERTAERLATAAAQARAAHPGDRELAENALGRELRELPADLPGVPNGLRTDLAGTLTRVALARRFYNDAVRDTRELRGRRFARWLRLHRSRPLPRYFDIDDRLGAGIREVDPAGRSAR